MIDIGVDLHKTCFTACFLQKGREVHLNEYRTNSEGIEQFLQQLKTLKGTPKNTKVAVETTGNVWNFVRRIEKAVKEVQVINTKKFKVIVQSTSKTDNRDAQTIAHYLWKDMLPKVVLPDVTSREIAKIVKIRGKMVKRMTELKNEIHALYTEEGIEIKKSLLTSQKGLDKLENITAPETVCFLAKLLIEELKNIKKNIYALECQLEKMTTNDKTVELLRSIPGTGLICACAVRGVLADIHRFDNPKKVAAYAGLVPWVSNSNERVCHGHITKNGSSLLRNAFVQMAMGIIRRWHTGKGKRERLFHWYQRLVGRVGGSKSKIALARKMSEIVWVMLHSQQSFNTKAA